MRDELQLLRQEKKKFDWRILANQMRDRPQVFFKFENPICSLLVGKLYAYTHIKMGDSALRAASQKG